MLACETNIGNEIDTYFVRADSSPTGVRRVDGVGRNIGQKQPDIVEKPPNIQTAKMNNNKSNTGDGVRPDNTVCSDHTLAFQHKEVKIPDELDNRPLPSLDFVQGLGEYIEFFKEEDQPLVAESTNGDNVAGKVDNVNNTQEDVTEKEDNEDNTQEEEDEVEDQEEYGEPCDPKHEVKNEYDDEYRESTTVKEEPKFLVPKEDAVSTEVKGDDVRGTPGNSVDIKLEDENEKKISVNIIQPTTDNKKTLIDVEEDKVGLVPTSVKTFYSPLIDVEGTARRDNNMRSMSPSWTFDIEGRLYLIESCSDPNLNKQKCLYWGRVPRNLQSHICINHKVRCRYSL